MDSTETEQKQNLTKDTISNPLLLVSPFNFIQSIPFFRQPLHSNSKPNFRLLTAAISTSNAVSQLQTSVTSAADKCLKFLHVIACQNEFLHKFLSFPFHLQRCFQQVPHRNQYVSTLSHHNFAAVLPGDSVAGVVVANGILNFLNIYNTLLVVRLVLTWFPTAPPALVSPLSTLCDPYLNIFRGIIPPLGGTLDLSPILAFLVLNAFTSAAAALPAELPPTGGQSQGSPTHDTANNLTTSQKKWMRRISGTKSKSSYKN